MVGLTTPISALFWTLGSDVLSGPHTYEAQALVYTLAGIANSGSATPLLLLNTSGQDFDFPASDGHWYEHYGTRRATPSVGRSIRAKEPRVLRNVSAPGRIGWGWGWGWG